MEGLEKQCSKVLVLLSSDPRKEAEHASEESEDEGQEQEPLKPIKKLKDMLITGTTMPEEHDKRFFEGMVNTHEWKLSNSHGLMDVELTAKSSQKLKDAATILQNIYLIGLLSSSAAKEALQNLPLIAGLQVVTITAKCESFAWNRMDVLALTNAIKSTVGKVLALSLSAALWEPTNKDKKEIELKNCSDWMDNTEYMMSCTLSRPLEECRGPISVFVDNQTINEVYRPRTTIPCPSLRLA
ncbi:uncharacterized protein LOC125941042 [Dermacentor silvarum]|uniref:uncharacterized protein LOC125941042 n=1 Tax=Dermacentor silvarum TaxID=543639 RepID=UPI002100D8E0|nr:uncharacterized protein LOC125941042 [Dermacentor silvarum]